MCGYKPLEQTLTPKDYLKQSTSGSINQSQNQSKKTVQIHLFSNITLQFLKTALFFSSQLLNCPVTKTTPGNIAPGNYQYKRINYKNNWNIAIFIASIFPIWLWVSISSKKKQCLQQTQSINLSKITEPYCWQINIGINILIHRHIYAHMHICSFRRLLLN